jgi:hypothetical protein
VAKLQKSRCVLSDREILHLFVEFQGACVHVYIIINYSRSCISTPLGVPQYGRGRGGARFHVQNVLGAKNSIKLEATVIFSRILRHWFYNFEEAITGEIHLSGVSHSVTYFVKPFSSPNPCNPAPGPKQPTLQWVQGCFARETATGPWYWPFTSKSRVRMNRVILPPLPSGNIPGTHFCWRLGRHRGHSAAGRIMSMKNSSDTIGNRSRDLPVCSSVPQPLHQRLICTVRTLN